PRGVEPPAAPPSRMTRPTPTPSRAAVPIAVAATPSAPHPTVAPITQITRASASSLDPTLREAASPFPANMPPDAAPSLPASMLQDAAPPLPTNITLLGVSPPPSSTAASPFSALPSMTVLRAQTASPAHIASAPTGSPVIAPQGVPRATEAHGTDPAQDPPPSVAEHPASASGPMPVLGSSPMPVQSLAGFGTWSPVPAQVRDSRRPASRIHGPLIAVIVIASAIGCSVVRLLMKAGGGPSPKMGVAAKPPSTAGAGSSGASDTPPLDGQDAPTTGDHEIAMSPPEHETSPPVHQPPADAPTPTAPGRRTAVQTGQRLAASAPRRVTERRCRAAGTTTEAADLWE
ncbi:MAG TPA: hypothetical protein VHN14_10785, partial [Kofleriaceae bacterium]|nr:hypothetical protein [Kofleriaceae bacterium]